MTLHLIKLAVGIESADRFETIIQERAQNMPVMTHTTRNVPRRREELLASGSLYWVIKGTIALRQKFVAIDVEKDPENNKWQCHLRLALQPIRVIPRQHRPFQGWRYLKAEDAPPDITGAQTADHIPAALDAALKEIGVYH